jgi:rhodanese-related sulfurtransferase
MWQRGSTANRPTDLTVDQTKDLADRGEIALLDVREPDEWVEGHIEGATWIPLGDLMERYQELDPEKHWVAYCHVGGRSAQAAYFLHSAGLTRVSNMLGGIAAWERRRYPTVSGQS